jgi:hypothetical protein
MHCRGVCARCVAQAVCISWCEEQLQLQLRACATAFWEHLSPWEGMIGSAPLADTVEWCTRAVLEALETLYAAVQHADAVMRQLYDAAGVCLLPSTPSSSL